MSLADTRMRGCALNWRLAVNGIHSALRSYEPKPVSTALLMLPPDCAAASAAAPVVRTGARSLERDVGGLDDLAPLGGFLADEYAELLRRGRGGFGAHLRQALPYFGRLQ